MRVPALRQGKQTSASLSSFAHSIADTRVQPVDVWAVGCIFAELLRHEAFFQGDNPQHQLEVIVSKIGKHISSDVSVRESRDILSVGCPPRHKLEFVESAVGNLVFIFILSLLLVIGICDLQRLNTFCDGKINALLHSPLTSPRTPMPSHWTSSGGCCSSILMTGSDHYIL